MTDEVIVILDLSHEVQSFLDDQRVDLYHDLQQVLPAIRIAVQSDPMASAGSKDLATVILASASLVSALTPIILRILNQISPPNRTESWIVEETVTQSPDGNTTIQRKRVLSSREQRMVELQLPDRQPKSPAPHLPDSSQPEK